MTTPAEIRRKRETLRKWGLYAVVLGVLAALAGVVAVFLQVQVAGVNGGMFCGGVIDTLWFPPLPNACAGVLADHARFAMLMGVIALAGFVAGGILIARGSRSGIVKVSP